MTVNISTLLEATQVANAQTTQYTVPPSTKVIIDKFTATNNTGATATLTVNLVPNAGAAAAANIVLAAKAIAANECYTCPELVGQILATGDFISTLSGTNNAITIRVSGRLVT